MIRIYETGQISDAEIFARSTEQADVADTVTAIIEDVKNRGDEALRYYAEKFDHAVLDELEVSEKEIEEAVRTVDPQLLAVFSQAGFTKILYSLISAMP